MAAKIKDNNNKERITKEKQWRIFFPGDMLVNGQDLYTQNKVKQFYADERSAHAEIIDGTKVYSVSVRNAPNSLSSEWDPDTFKCTCKKKRKVRKFNRYSISHCWLCEHEAALLLRWEASHGPWEFTESDEEYQHRLYIEDLEKRKKRLEEQKKAESEVKLPAKDFFTGTKSGGFFDITKAVENQNTTLFAVNRAIQLMEHGQIKDFQYNTTFGRDGGQIFIAQAKIEDELEKHETRIAIGFDGFTGRYCSCNYYSRYSDSVSYPLCEHELILLKQMGLILERENFGEATDQKALRFFEAMASPTAQTSGENREEAAKEKCLILTPRITTNGADVSLTFKMGRVDDPESGPAETPQKRLTAQNRKPKINVVKNLRTLADAYAEEGEFSLSKTQLIDFSREDFIDESLPWLTFVQRRVSESAEVNNRLQARSYYGFSPTLRMQDSLTGAMLDQFYEVAEGGIFECQNKIKNETGTISVGHTDMRVRLKTEPVADQNGVFYGVLVTGSMPVILPGSSGSYILGNGKLSKISKEEETVLEPFHNAADDQGNIRFRVGKDSLSEFYYRIVPSFLESRYIDFEDKCENEAEAILPPEAKFLFRLDISESNCFCEAYVTYGEHRYNILIEKQSPGEYRDRIQEGRVNSVLRKYFKFINQNRFFYWNELSDDYLYRIMTEAIPEMSQYGEVQGTEAFNRLKVRPAPTVQVGVSIESGLMDISVISKDMSPEELLEILGSYRLKKKYHRLKSGEFVLLSKNDQLDSLENMLTEVGLHAEDVIGKEAHLPMYRALYLDAMLKKHEELAANRDKTYRALVKNFATIRDADYETPNAQSDVLRPYQVYGFKWMRTLCAAGFGGILADEMGLGKTIQAITLLQSLKDEGVPGTSMIVCPASLVYNWQEEIRRFAPDLSVEPVAGTAAQRKKLIAGIVQPAGKPHTDILITSYDLFRKDFALYKDICFTVMILDEAQYIKNQKAALTKAVKSATSKYRFALTGTPVENRLAELWSIFDYLMPGFLFSYQEFSGGFETPVVKNHDETVSARLRQMTSPFILRRLKTDVLKDLPEKLEEVRYTRFEEDQRKVYDGQVVHMKQMLEGIGTKGEDKLKVLTELMRIRQICCDPSLLFEDYNGGSAKREACLDLIQSAISGGHRMLVFSQFTSMLTLLEEDLNREGIPYMKLTGATPKEQRIRMVREFNEGSTPVFLISLKAGGTGLNLTGADVVIHYDPWWNIAAQNQATDRAHRIGQINTVTVYRLIVKDSIEEKILALQEAKRDLADSILTGDHTAITSMSTDELLELLS